MQAPRIHAIARLKKNWRNGLLWGFTGAVLLTWLSAAPSGFWVGALIVTAFLALVFLPVAFMRVDLLAEGHHLRAALVPLFHISVPLDRVVTAHGINGKGGFADGLGIRRLGHRSWGLLVGGPAISLELTNGRIWVISTPNPERITSWLKSISEVEDR